MALQFPQNPTLGDLFLADNAVTYAWNGVAWDSSIPIHNGTAEYAYVGGVADTVFTVLDNSLDGGTA
jgi:hypothetical protein